jgi:hypothetical protein
MIKKTKRRAFNFLRSYFDVLNELTNDKDKLDFLTAIINKQFLNEDPIELNFIVNLCYESQRHQIETSVKGWLRATKEELSTTPMTTPMTTLPTTPMTTIPTNGKEEEEEEKVKEEKEHISFDERVNKFLLWFNSQKEVNGFKKGNFSVLSKATESNFKKILKTNYSSEQLNKAFKNMCNNTWVRENNKITPDHFLRIDNLEKYINQEDVVSNKSEDARVNHIKDLIEKYGTVK